jgi:hypothetical protein
VTRSNRSARQAGQRFERSIANYLRDELDDRIDIRPKNGTNDRGDIGGIRTTYGREVVAELKDHNRFELSTWIGEAAREAANADAVAGVVIAKRRGVADPGQQFVICTVDDLLALLSIREPREW